MKAQLLQKEDLNDITRQVFVNIFKKDLHELTDFDISFLRSRRDYLDEDELEKYAEFLEIKDKSIKKKVKKVK